MATSKEQLQLIIGAQDKASSKLKSVGNQIKNIAIAAGGLYAVKRVFTDVVGAAIEAEKVWNDVRASLQRHNYQVAEAQKAVMDFASDMQVMTGVSDEVIGESVQLLLDYNNDLRTSFRLTQTAADLAAGAHMDLRTAVDLVGKASVGYTGTLSRYGIIVDQNLSVSQKFEEAIKQINERFGGAAQAQMDAYAGKAKLMIEQWGDFKENIGAFIIPAISDLTVALSELFENVNKSKSFLDGVIRTIGSYMIISSQYYGAAGGEILNLVNELNRQIEKSNEAINKKTIDQLDEAAKSATQANKQFVQASEANLEYYIAYGEKFFAQVDAQRRQKTNEWVALQRSYYAAEGQMVFEYFRNIREKRETEMAHQQAEAEKWFGFMTAQGRKFAGVITGTLRGMRVDAQKIWAGIAIDFVKFFIAEALSQMKATFATRFLGFLASLFDTRANDMMAMRQGRHFAHYFMEGTMQQMRSADFGKRIAASLTDDYINRKIVPVVEGNARIGVSKLSTKSEYVTGDVDVIFN